MERVFLVCLLRDWEKLVRCVFAAWYNDWPSRCKCPQVYAVEASDMAQYASAVAKQNGLDDCISVIEGKLESVEIPEEVDLIISEWMGTLLIV